MFMETNRNVNKMEWLIEMITWSVLALVILY